MVCKHSYTILTHTSQAPVVAVRVLLELLNVYIFLCYFSAGERPVAAEVFPPSERARGFPGKLLLGKEKRDRVRSSRSTLI